MLHSHAITRELENYSKPDKIYATSVETIEPFRFDERVTEVFPDMIRRSVPGYEAMLDLIGLVTTRYAQPNTVCCDLGCSLGASTLALRRSITVPRTRVIGIDNAEAMIRRCREVIKNDDSPVPVDIVLGDVCSYPIHRASVVTMNLTMQFIDVDKRTPMLARVRQGLLPGGVFFLAEKVCDANAANQALFTDLHHRFKKARGYSELEISQKRSSLEDVLVPETLDTHIDRLRKLGFSQVSVLMQHLQFACILAIA